MERTPVHRLLVSAALAASLVGVGVGAPAALAKDPEVRASGSCSAGATWKLKAKGDDGRPRGPRSAAGPRLAG